MISLIAHLWRRVPHWLVAVADQGVVALVNLSLSVIITQTAGVEVLGRFAIVATTTTLCMGVARLLVTDPWLASRTASRQPVPELRWLVVMCSVGASAMTAVVVALSCGGEARWWIAPPLAGVIVIQDFGRYLMFRAERASGALISDSAVLLGAALTFAIAMMTGVEGLTAALLSWLVGMLLGVISVPGPLLGPLTVVGAARWWRAHCRYLASRLAFDTTAYMAGVSGSLYLLAYVGTQRDVGLVRIVQTLFSPAALVVAGLSMWLVPLLANRPHAQGTHIRARSTMWLTGGALPLVVAGIAVGPWFARHVFGADQAPTFAPLALAALSTVAMAVAAPWLASARVSGHYLPIAWARASAAALTLLGMVTLTFMRGTTGYLALLAFQNLVVAAAAIRCGLRPPRVARSKRRSCVSG